VTFGQQFLSKCKMYWHESVPSSELCTREVLYPGPYTHDGIYIDVIMEHGPSPIHFELVPLPTVASNHVNSAFLQGVLTSGLSSCQSQDNQWHHLWPYLPFLPILIFTSFDYGEKLICHIST
jgi:hypothetical protein